MIVVAAVWAGVGYLISRGWGLYWASIDPAAPPHDMVRLLEIVTVPGARIGSFLVDGPHGLQRASLENAAAFGLIGATIHLLRRRFLTHPGSA
jgi:hypothetical protein